MSERRIQIIAHRGASAYAPENTLSAFERAISLGADCFELDCTLSKDGEVVVIHDDTVDRTTRGSGSVRDLTFEELREYEYGAWFGEEFDGESIPTLAEALELAKDRIGAFIEVKNSAEDQPLLQELTGIGDENETLLPAHSDQIRKLLESSGSANVRLAKKVIEIVRQSEMAEDVVIQSFSPVVVATAMLSTPRIRTEQLGTSDAENPGRWGAYLNWFERLHPDGFNPGLDDVTKDLVERVHAAGKTVSVWTVNESEDMRRLVEWGIDGIITNYPDRCRKIVG